MKPILTLLAALLPLFAATAQSHGETAVIPIWDNTTAPHSNGITAAESEPEPCRLENTTGAALHLYAADPAHDTGMAVVICPGGGYMKLCMDYEGYDVARWFAAQGITAAVLKYRLPNGHPEVPLEDAQQALRILRGEVPGAEGHTAARVGIAGFSAGGHLAAAVSTLGTVRPTARAIRRRSRPGRRSATSRRRRPRRCSSIRTTIRSSRRRTARPTTKG